MLALVVLDIVVVVVTSVAIGASAPRWPRRWLTRDPFPLAVGPFESSRAYRRLGVTALIRRLPEAGSAFGGRSKSRLPGLTAEHLQDYLVEVRRAEWVHWLSMASSLVLFAFNPWPLAVGFVAVVSAGNAPFIVVLRHNRLRLLAIVNRNGNPS